MEIKKNLPAIIHPSVIVSPHPLSASVGRRLLYDKFVANESLGDYLDRLDLVPVIRENFILSINGRPIEFDEAYYIYPRQGDVVILRARVHGGDDGGSDPLRVALMVAVLVASQGTAAGWVGLMTGTSLAVGSSVVLVGGMLLVSALVPLKIPTKGDDEEPSPTYSLSGGANKARQYSPLPIVYGIVRMFADHGAMPFTDYIGDDQILTQIFNFGLSDITYSDYKIGDTPISEFEGVNIEESAGFTGILNSYPATVETIAGGNLIEPIDTFIERTSGFNSTKLTIDLSGLLYYYGVEFGLTMARVYVTAEYKLVGDVTWLPFFRLLTWGGGGWGDYSRIKISNDDKVSIRKTYNRYVTSGQYIVRVKIENLAEYRWYSTECVDDEAGLATCTNTVHWTALPINEGSIVAYLNFDQLKSYQPDESDYTNQKRVSLTITANAQLNGRVDSFNAEVRSQVPVWVDPSWVTQTSSNPAWQFLHLAKGKFHNGRRIYGGGLPDARIDIETIKLWAIWCTAKGLNCNIVFDSKMTVIDMLNTIAKCGRATSTWTNGTLGVVYDEANKPVTAVFGMSNIILNSFKVTYVTMNQVDEIVAAFVNPAINWKRDTVRAVVPGVVSPVNSVIIDLPGVTSLAQATKEANLLAAAQLYRRRIMTWETDMEGLTVQRGEVGILSHDSTQWDYSGRLISGTTLVLQLDRDVPFTPLTNHYIGVKHPDGTYEIVPVDLLVGEHNNITLTTPLSVSPDADVNNTPQDYMWSFGPRATPGKLVKITDITPLSQDRVRITATDEDDAYYLSESNSVYYVPPGAYLGRTPTIYGLSLGESLTVVGNGFGPLVNVTWGVSGEYGGAFIRAGTEDTGMRDVGRTLDKSFSFQWPVGNVIVVEVTTYNMSFESKSASKDSASLLLVGKMKLPSDVANFTVLQNGESVILKWSQPPDLDLNGTEIRYGKRGSSTWEDATPLTEVTKGTNITTLDVVDGDWTFYAKHKDTSLNYSLNAVSSDVVFDSDKDIIEQVEQSPDFIGTLVNFVKHHTGKLVPQSQDADSTDGGTILWEEDTVFEIFVNNPYQICTYEAPAIDIGFDDVVRVWGDIQSALGPGETGIANPQLSIDYRKDADAYDGFENWSVGNAELQHVKHKLTLDTDQGVAYISGFLPTVDLLERTDKEQFVIAPGGTTVTFAKPFHRAPFGSADGVSILSGTLAYATIENITTTQALINVYNTGGVSAGGNAVASLTGV